MKKDDLTKQLLAGAWVWAFMLDPALLRRSLSKYLPLFQEEKIDGKIVFSFLDKGNDSFSFIEFLPKGKKILVGRTVGSFEISLSSPSLWAQRRIFLALKEFFEVLLDNVMVLARDLEEIEKLLGLVEEGEEESPFPHRR